MALTPELLRALGLDPNGIHTSITERQGVPLSLPTFEPPAEIPPEEVPLGQSIGLALADAMRGYAAGLQGRPSPRGFSERTQLLRQRRAERANERALSGAKTKYGSKVRSVEANRAVALAEQDREAAIEAARVDREFKSGEADKDRLWKLGMLEKEQDFMKNIEMYRGGIDLEKEKIRNMGKRDRAQEMLVEHNEGAAEEIALLSLAQRAAVLNGEESRSRKEVKREFLATARARFRGPDRETYLREQELNWEEDVGSAIDEMAAAAQQAQAEKSTVRQVTEAGGEVGMSPALSQLVGAGIQLSPLVTPVVRGLAEYLNQPSPRAERYRRP